MESDYDFHVRRARAELDLAYRATGWAAMSSHLKLSTFHMARLRAMSAYAPTESIDRGAALAG